MKKPQPDTDDYHSDILDLQRKILKGVQLKDVDFVDKLQGQERINFLKYCSDMAQGEWFDRIFPALFFDQLIASANAENFNEVVFHRATMNGLSLVKEFFKKHARQFDIEFGSPDVTEKPFKAFEPILNKE